MADNDFEKFESSIKALQDSCSKLTERTRQLSRHISELEKELGRVNEYRHDLDARIRVLESENVEAMKQDLYRTESRVNAFETQHDDRKEKWSMAINFVVQLAWVSMAASLCWARPVLSSHGTTT